jgi:hypothetical protein
MPLPSQLASGNHTWRDFIIDFSPTDRDIDYYSTWFEAEKPSDFDSLYFVIKSDWKISVTPSSNAEMPYIALTCRRSGAYLQGHTIALKNVGIDACLSFSYWLVQATIGLVAAEVDGFLTMGSGWEANDAGKAQKIASDDEIPF